MKTLRLSPLAALLLILSASYLLLSFGTPLAVLAYSASEWLGFFVLTLFQGAGFLLLLCSLGAAFGAVSEGRGYLRPYLILLFAVLAYLLGTVAGLFWQALFLKIAVTAEELALMLGSLLDSAILPLLVVFLLADRIFLVKGGAEPRNMRDTSASAVRGAILATSLLFAYRLVGQIMETVSFIDKAMGLTFVKTGERVAMVLDYIPVLALPTAGYFLLLLCRRAWLRFSLKRDEEPPKATKKKSK